MSRFDIVLGHFVFCSQHHEGQGSKLYEELSQITRYLNLSPLFSESRFFDPVEAEFANARTVYRELCDKHRVPHRFPALIAVDRDEEYAPCSFLVCRVKNPEAGPDRYCWDRYGEENSVLIQTDWDRPGVARTFGWSGDDADIKGATEYLDSCVANGRVVEDPGYFSSGTKGGE